MTLAETVSLSALLDISRRVMVSIIGREENTMSDDEYRGDTRESEPSPSCKQGDSDYSHSYRIGSGKSICKRPVHHRIKLLCSRTLQLITHACKADCAVLITSACSFLYDGVEKIHIFPEPASDEEARLWKYVAAYIGESIRLGVPLSIPGSLRDALNLRTILVSPVFKDKEVSLVVAIFAKSSSPPLDSEDEKTLCRLTDKFMHVFHTAVSPGNKRSRPHKVLRVLRARNILLSINELCSVLDGLVELVASLGLAESVYVRILDENTNTLKLVALAGKRQGAGIYSDVPASRCPIMQPSSRIRTLKCVDSHQCSALNGPPEYRAVCAPLSSDSGSIGVLSLWNPSQEGWSAADIRIVDAVIATAEKAFLETAMFSAGLKTRARAAFIEYASIASRASEDITHIAREFLAGLRRIIDFQVGAFVNCRNGFDVFSVLFSSANSLITLSDELEGQNTNGDSSYGLSGDAVASIILGDSEAEEWANEALKHLEPDLTHMFLRPFYMHNSSWPSCLVVPLVSAGETMGLLIIGKPKGDKFTKEDLDFCESIRQDLILLWENFMARLKPETSPAVEAMLERIETLEQLAVGTAHEIKNPLSVIKGYLQVLQFDQGVSHEIRQRIERLLRQVDQISRIADDLAGLARLGTVDISLISLPKILDEVLDTIQPQATNAGVSIVREYSEDIQEIPGDAGKLQQAFLNVCRNAVEAMSAKGGELRVTIRASGDMRNIEVEFRDTGPGISREALTMMFRPFFTTKRNGTGLGLNISMHIARLHGGTVRAENVKGGKGAVFTVVLPLVRN